MSATNLYSILESLETKLKEIGNDDSLEATAKRLDVNESIDLITKCIKIGIIRKIDKLPYEKLKEIALKTISPLTISINPDIYISEYNKFMNYLKMYHKEINRIKKALPNCVFTLEGELEAIVDKAGNPKGDFTILSDYQLKINSLLGIKKANDKIKVKVRVPSDFFTEKELNDLAFKKDPLDNSLIGFTCRIVKVGENVDAISIINEPETSEMIKTDYDYYKALDNMDRVKKMGIILPEVELKKKLLENPKFLKEYVQRILVADDSFIDNYVYAKDHDSKEYIEYNFLYNNEMSEIFDEQFKDIIDNLNGILFNNLKKMFDTKEKTDAYIKIFELSKNKAIKDMPGLYITPLDNIDLNNLKNIRIDKNGIFALPEFFTNDDIALLVRFKPITKIIDGRSISFALDITKYDKLRGYSTDEKRNTTGFIQDLKIVIFDYKRNVKEKHQRCRDTILECDKKINLLNEVKKQIEEPEKNNIKV